jgi:hypothetical protein
MPLDYPQAGTGYAAEFQSSAIPWVTSSVGGTTKVRYSFPYVTRFLYVANLGSGTDKIAVAFTELGLASSSNYVQLNAGQSLNLELRVADVFLSSSQGTPAYSVCAGLTTVPRKNMFLLTGSNGWGGVG